MKALAHAIICPLLILLMTLAGSAGWASGSRHDDVYRSIMEKKMIRIGISKDYPPLNFNAGERGVEIELARGLAEFMGVRFELVPLEISEYAEALGKRRVDVVIGGFSRNLIRARTVWFSEPYCTVTPGVLADIRSLPKTSFGDRFEQKPIATIWDLKRVPGFRFAVKKGSAYEHLLLAEFPDMPRTVVATNEEGVALLNRRDVDGFVHDSLFLDYYFANSARLRNAFLLLSGGSRIESICVGLPFGDAVLKNQVDVFIRETVRLGHIEKWLEEHSKKQ